MNLVGKIIGNRYEILKEIGSGGMAIVYKAKDHVLNREVAVKVLRDEYTTDQDFIKRFNTEAQSAASLQHQNIVSIFDVGHEEENDLYYIVMELVKGKTLKEIINKDGKLSWKWAVNIAIQIASALEVAHKNGIIHRDIKPHNIIITEDGVAKVTDFGIAKAVSNSTITSFGTTIGSVHYFSPEQAKGSITDAKSDLYSLGVVMYEMLTGKVPFDADTPVSIALKHMQETPVAPMEVNSEIPKSVNDIILKAMEKEPSKRYQSATEMIKDLNKALKDPDGDFVENEDDDIDLTKVMDAVKDDKKKVKKGFFYEHPRTKIAVKILSLVLIFIVVFLITKIILDGGIKQKVRVPDVTGKNETEATTIITDAGLVVGNKIEEASSEVEEGKIISQDPKHDEKEKVEKGTAVNLVISKGPETTDMVDFTGENIEDVRKKAEELGLILEESTENSDSVKENCVISQSVKVGTKVKSGDKIKVVVSLGKKKVTVPTVIDMDEGTAKATLTNANLVASVTYTNDDTKTNGKVISQSVEQGKEVEEGTKIEIVVNKIEDAKVNISLNVKVSSSAFASNTKSNETNETTAKKTSEDASISVTVNGETQISSKAITIDLTKSENGVVSIGQITGKGTQKVVITSRVNGKNVTIYDGYLNFDNYEGSTFTTDYNVE